MKTTTKAHIAKYKLNQEFKNILSDFLNIFYYDDDKPSQFYDNNGNDWFIQYFDLNIDLIR